MFRGRHNMLILVYQMFEKKNNFKAFYSWYSIENLEEREKTL